MGGSLPTRCVTSLPLGAGAQSYTKKLYCGPAQQVGEGEPEHSQEVLSHREVCGQNSKHVRTPPVATVMKLHLLCRCATIQKS